MISGKAAFEGVNFNEQEKMPSATYFEESRKVAFENVWFHSEDNPYK